MCAHAADGDGGEELLALALAQHPYTELPLGTAVHVSVRLGDGDHYPHDVAGLERLATDLVEAASEVRRMARLLAVVARDGER